MGRILPETLNFMNIRNVADLLPYPIRNMSYSCLGSRVSQTNTIWAPWLLDRVAEEAPSKCCRVAVTVDISALRNHPWKFWSREVQNQPWSHVTFYKLMSLLCANVCKLADLSHEYAYRNGVRWRFFSGRLMNSRPTLHIDGRGLFW